MTEEMKEAYCYRVPELLPEEKNFPLAKFYTDYPLVKPGPLQQQVLDAGPMPVSEAIPVEHWLDLLDPKKTRNIVYGYTMMPDGSGFTSSTPEPPPPGTAPGAAGTGGSTTTTQRA